MKILSQLVLLLVLIMFNTIPAGAELPASTMKDIEIFAKKSLDEKKDFEEVKKNLKILLLLDDEDPSRTAVMLLSESYNKHPALYEKALKSIENKKNVKNLKEIKAILKNFYKTGNG